MWRDARGPFVPVHAIQESEFRTGNPDARNATKGVEPARERSGTLRLRGEAVRGAGRRTAEPGRAAASRPVAARELAQREEGVKLGVLDRDLEPFGARLAHGVVDRMRALRRFRAVDRPRGVRVRAARARHDQRKTLPAVSPEALRGPRDARELLHALEGEREV